MITQFYPLLHAFKRSAEPPPQNLSEALRTLPPVGVLPLLWTTWLFIGLLVFRTRQIWAESFVRQHLPDAFPPGHIFQTAEPGDEFTLPGAPEWRVALEPAWGFGDLKHIVTEEWVTFDLTGEYIEPIIYLLLLECRITQPVSPWHPAGWLLELHPSSEDMIRHAIDDLVAVQYLTAINDDGEPFDPDLEPPGYRLNYEIAERYSPHVLQFCERWKDPSQRLWLAALIGDWLLAHELAQQTNDAGLIVLTGERAAECNKLRAEAIHLADLSSTWSRENWHEYDRGATT